MKKILFLLFLLIKSLSSMQIEKKLNIFIHGIYVDKNDKKDYFKNFFVKDFENKLSNNSQNGISYKKGIVGEYRFIQEGEYISDMSLLPKNQKNQEAQNNYFLLWGKNLKFQGICSQPGYRETAAALKIYIDEYRKKNNITEENLNLNLVVHSHGGQVLRYFLESIKNTKLIVSNLFLYEVSKTKKLEDAVYIKRNKMNIVEKIVDINGFHNKDFLTYDFTAQFPICFKRFYRKEKILEERLICIKNENKNCDCSHMLPNKFNLNNLILIFNSNKNRKLEKFFLEYFEEKKERLKNIFQLIIYNQNLIYSLILITYLIHWKKDILKIKLEQLKKHQMIGPHF